MNPITLPIAELKPALTGLGKVINRHATLPVLGCVKIERTPDGWVALTTTDLDHFITVRLEQPAKGESLTVLVPHEDLVKLTKSCGRDEQILIEPKDKNLVSIRFSLGEQFGEQPVKAPGADEFPPMPRLKCDPIPLPEPLRHMVHEAMQCTSEDPARYVLHGAYVDVTKPKAHHVVATDGKHLYSANSLDLPLKKSVIIPRHKFLGWSEFNRDGEWQLRVSDSPDSKHLQLNSRRWRFITRQIEGNFPNWRQVLPDPQLVKTTITLDPRTLPNIIQTIQRVPCDSEANFTIGIEWRQNQLFLLGRAPGAGAWAKVLIPEAKGVGRDTTVFLNRRFLVKALEFGMNTIAIIDEMAPMCFGNGSRQLVVMPVRDDPSRSIPAPKPPPVVNGHCAGPAGPSPTPKPTSKAPNPVAVGRAANGMPLPAQRKPSGPSRPRPRPSTPPRIDDALEAVGGLREAFRSGLAAIRGITAQLRGIKTSHRATEKEVEAVRSKVRSLQNFKL